MLRKILLSLALIGFFASPAMADATNPEIDKSKSVAVSTSSVEILPANKNRKYLLIQNVCAAQNIGVSPSGTTAAIATAGTVTLLPGGSLLFTGNAVPKNAFNAISASGSCGVTIWELD